MIALLPMMSDINLIIDWGCVGGGKIFVVLWPIIDLIQYLHS